MEEHLQEKKIEIFIIKLTITKLTRKVQVMHKLLYTL